jgi:hypothetical protein
MVKFKDFEEHDMLIYSLIVNTLLVIVTIILVMRLYQSKKQVKLLFLRAWRLELTLMDVYNKTIDENSFKIIFGSACSA